MIRGVVNLVTQVSTLYMESLQTITYKHSQLTLK